MDDIVNPQYLQSALTFPSWSDTPESQDCVSDTNDFNILDFPISFAF